MTKSAEDGVRFYVSNALNGAKRSAHPCLTTDAFSLRCNNERSIAESDVDAARQKRSDGRVNGAIIDDRRATAMSTRYAPMSDQTFVPISLVALESRRATLR